MSIDLSKMPKLGFGMMRLPEPSGEIDIAQVCDMTDEYLKLGKGYFDTAYIYLGGRSERAVKTVLTERHDRDAFYLATKLPQWMMDGKAERADVIFNDQLERTGAGFFDFYLLHSVEDGGSIETYERLGCFDWGKKKKEQGLIKHFGFSYHGSPELLEQVLDKHPEVEFVQIQLNYADWQSPIVQSGKLYKILSQRNIPMIVMEPVKGGMLASVAPEIEAEMKKEQPEKSVASWALRFAASLPGVMTVLSGMSNREQMLDNISTFSSFEPLSEREKEIIKLAERQYTSSNTIQCTSCRYCCDGCPQSISIPDIFSAMNTITMYGEDMRPHFFYDGLTRTGGRAGSCIGCAQCEEVCPQHLPIRELLANASKVFDKK